MHDDPANNGTADDGRPLRHFPDTYSIKAVGKAAGKDPDDFASHATAIVMSVVDAQDTVSHKTRESKNGTYLSVTIDFVARDQEELDRVFTTMNADDRVVWVL